VVVVLNDLDLDLELIDLGLHELLSNLSKELEVKFNEAALHNLLAELNGLLLALLNDLPELIGEGIGALMQFLLCLVVLAQIRVFVREAVEVLGEVVEDGLLAIARVQELQELSLELSLLAACLLPLQADVAEDALHLVLVVLRQVTPHLDDDRLEVSI